MQISQFFTFALSVTANTTFGAGIVSLDLISPQDNQTVAPGQRIDWRIEFVVSSGDNAGLALLLVDVVQGIFNPELIDIPPATAAPIHMSKFNAPAGFSNVPNGYGGVLDGNIGERNLRQIGGGQNTFGQPGQVMGQDAIVEGGVGQSGPLILAEGFFNAPSVAGIYSFQIETAVANTLDAINAPPNASPVSPAAVLFEAPLISFTVDASVVVIGDLNCDGAVDHQDIEPFVLAVIDAASYATAYPNCNANRANINGDMGNDGRDVSEFVTCLLSGCP